MANTQVKEQLKTNNDLLKSLLPCIDNKEQQRQAREIVVNTDSLLLHLELNDKPLFKDNREPINNEREKIGDLLLNRDIPSTKPLITLCEQAINKRGKDNFIFFLDKFNLYRNTHDIKNLASFFNKCLCNYKDHGRIPLT